MILYIQRTDLSKTFLLPKVDTNWSNTNHFMVDSLSLSLLEMRRTLGPTQIASFQKIVVSFSCICPIIDHEFHHNVVKVAVDPWGDSWVDLESTLTMLWRHSLSITGQRLVYMSLYGVLVRVSESQWCVGSNSMQIVPVTLLSNSVNWSMSQVRPEVSVSSLRCSLQRSAKNGAEWTLVPTLLPPSLAIRMWYSEK